MIETVDESNILEAATVFSISWIESHREICSSEFLSIHTPERQSGEIRRLIGEGWAFYIAFSPSPSGIISVRNGEVSTLYVLPTEERKGVGSSLLEHVEKTSGGETFLWCRKDNTKALSFYASRGYRETGRIIERGRGVVEVEMRKTL